MPDKKDFMREAIRLSFETMRSNTGGPFGCVVVKDGKIIARGFNKVVSTMTITPNMNKPKTMSYFMCHSTTKIIISK